MGELIQGVWHSGGVESAIKDGALHRPPSVYRHTLVAPGGDGPFVAEAGRYHLYVSLACPWASRTTIMRHLKGLEAMIGLSVVNWHMGDDGWSFLPGPGVIPDDINGVTYIRDLYVLDDPRCSTRATVPILWDKATRRIVSNESAEILRMLNHAFDTLGAAPGDYYPPEHRAEIDMVNDRVYPGLNNGVYRAGMATTQPAYDKAVAEVFETLDWLEERLGGQRYLVGPELTEADIRLFTTLVRFDLVYNYHFKCNVRMLTDYPALWAYTRDLYQRPAFRPTVNFEHIRQHYYGSHPWINPKGIVPAGPLRDFEEPSGRETLSAAD